MGIQVFYKLWISGPVCVYLNFPLEKSQSLICFLGDIVNMGTPAEVIRYCDPEVPYLAAVTLSSSVLWRKYLDRMGCFNLVTCRTWHFAGLKFISQDFSHRSSLGRSSCRMFASDNQLIARYMAVSSAKSLTLDCTCSGTSLIYARKRMGTRTEPCGTPEDTGVLSELIPLITTDCFLLSKKPLNPF